MNDASFSPESARGGVNPQALDDLRRALQDARRIEDVALPGLLEGVTLRSATKCGRIRQAHELVEANGGGLVHVDSRDLALPNVVPMGDRDEPILAADQVRYIGEPVALVAGEDPERLERLRRAFRVDCAEETPIDTIEMSLAAFQHLFAEDNVFQRYELSCGDLTRGFDDAETVVESKFWIASDGAGSHLPPGVIAVPRQGGGLTLVTTSPTWPDPRPVVGKGLGIDARDIDVVTLGATAEEATDLSLPAIHAALLARKAGRPVRLVYRTGEDIAASPRAHAAIVRHRSGFLNNGALVARDIMVFLDGGAYSTTSHEILLAALLHAPGPYRCANMRLRGRVVATHKPPRGGGVLDGVRQAILGGEAHLDHAARRLRLDRSSVRRQNALARGDLLVSGHAMGGAGAQPVLDAILAHARWRDPASSDASLPGRNRGTGLALSMLVEAFVGSRVLEHFAIQEGTGLVTPETGTSATAPLACWFGAQLCELAVDAKLGGVGEARHVVATDLGGFVASDAIEARIRNRGVADAKVIEVTGVEGAGALDAERTHLLEIFATLGSDAARSNAVADALERDFDHLPVTETEIRAAAGA